MDETQTVIVGAIDGEGSGPGEVGTASAKRTGNCLPPEIIDFCSRVFSRGGAILAGAAGDRFVYEMRRRFTLSYKLNPLRSYPELSAVSRLKPSPEVLDVLLVRENLAGLYQGITEESVSADGRQIRHTFVQDERQVRTVLSVAAEAARGRRKMIAVIGKLSALPSIHSLWHESAVEIAAAAGVEVSFLDVDYAAYKLIQHPESFDVIAAPNCFGDILSDLGGVLAGSRALTFGGSFSDGGASIHQTNHGAAYNLAGTDRANPAGQIFSLAMLLREAFALEREADAIEDAVRAVWRSGWRTEDIAEAGCETVGCRAFSGQVANFIRKAGAFH
jgi:3-isopropylmalate dehydrogenase